MSKNEEGLSLLEGGALIVGRVVPKPGTFTLIMSDTMCFEVTESGRHVDKMTRHIVHERACGHPDAPCSSPRGGCLDS